MAQQLIELRLKDCPEDVNNLIIKEQQRMAFFENKDLKKHQVVYEMLREWYKLKNQPHESKP